MDFLTYFLDTPGIGGIVAGLVIATLITTYALTIVWVSKGHEDKKD